MLNVVGYVRLSRDEDKENYSSIAAQQNMIADYAAGKGWKVSKIYTDYNFSVYTLDRPEFCSMLEEAKQGKVDVILAKDLSRIGRNNGRVLVLIESLREWGIRLLLITEAEGGLDLLEDQHDILGIKTWYNEMYIKDISRKIRANMHTMQKNGQLIMGNIYGYNKVKGEQKFQLTVDEAIRPIIKLIFQLYIQGLGYKRICDILNEKGCITPSEYLREKHENLGRVFKNSVAQQWQTHMIQRIIQNDVYIGTLRTQKKRARLIKGKQEKVPPEEQYVFENHHEAIVSEETFILAQEIKQKRNNKPYRNNKDKYPYIFSSFVECGDCGGAGIGLKLGKAQGARRGYNCSKYQKYGNVQCWNHGIGEEQLLFYFRELMQALVTTHEDYITNMKTAAPPVNSHAALKTLYKDLKQTKLELKLTISQKIKDLSKEDNIEYGEMIEKSYEELEAAKKKKIADLEKTILELERAENAEESKAASSNREILHRILHTEVPLRKDLEQILDKIVIYASKSQKGRQVDFQLKVELDKLVYQ